MLNVKIATPTAFARAVAELEAREAEVDAFHQEVWSVAYASFEAACSSIPHRQTTRSYRYSDSEEISPSTADKTAVAQAQAMLELLGERAADYEPSDKILSDYLTVARELVALQNERDAEIERLRQHYELDTKNTESDRLSGLAADALYAVQEARPTSLDEMREKLALLQELDAFHYEGVDDLMPDIECLIGQRNAPVSAEWLQASTDFDKAYTAWAHGPGEADAIVEEFNRATEAYVAIPAPSVNHALLRLQQLLRGDGHERFDVAGTLARLVDEAVDLSTAQ